MTLLCSWWYSAWLWYIFKYDMLEEVNRNASHIVCHSSPVGPKMSLLVTVVVPKVAYCWENIAHILEISSERIKIIKKNCCNDCEDCCAQLFSHWLSSANSVKPKTWHVLLNKLKEFKELTRAVEKIEQELKDRKSPKLFSYSKCIISIVNSLCNVHALCKVC